MTVPEITFVIATPAHVPVLAALHEGAFADSGTAPWDEASFSVLLTRPGAHAVLAINWAMTPINKQPSKFAVKVPQGNSTSRCKNTLNPNRAIAPSAPPTATNRYE